MKPIEIKVQLSPFDFVYDMTRQELCDLVYDIHCSQRDRNFTKEIIKDLCTSLQCECSKEEWEAFVKEL